MRDYIERQINAQTYIENQYITQVFQGKEKEVRRLLTSFPPQGAFEGREKELGQLNALITQNNHTHILSVKGIGGIGKSALAREYFIRKCLDFDFYIFLEGQQKDMLATLSHPALLDNLDLNDAINQIPKEDPERSDKVLGLIANALLNLQAKGKSRTNRLLVIDDVPTKNTQILQQLAAAGWRIITTSRERVRHAKEYELIELTPEDALRIFALYFGLETQELSQVQKEEVEKIINRLRYHVLAIELVAKNARHLGWSLEKLNQTLAEKGLNISDYADIETQHSGQKDIEHLFTYLLEIFPLEDLKEAELYLLNNYSVIPDEIIDKDTWAKILGKTEDHWQHQAQQLHKKGWLNAPPTEGGFRMHALLAEITRHKNQHRLYADCEKMIQFLIDELNWRDNPNYHQENYKYSTLYSRYAESVVSYFAEPNSRFSILCERIGSFYQTTGNLSQALHFYKKYENLAQKLVTQNPDSPDFKNSLAISYEKLGQTQVSLGNLGEALGYFEKYNQLEKELYAAYPTNVSFKNSLAISYSKLGEVQASLGNLGEALGYFEKYNQLEKELYAAYPTNVSFKNGSAISYEKLGQTQESLGNLEEALGYFE
ncbi:MAG: hypothetical protein JJT94_07500 [Bernardetiaceae bacterium]|nr:hypothetical protein [Bernardetiaceae bacterium]